MSAATRSALVVLASRVALLLLAFGVAAQRQLDVGDVSDDLAVGPFHRTGFERIVRVGHLVGGFGDGALDAGVAVLEISSIADFEH